MRFRNLIVPILAISLGWMFAGPTRGAEQQGSSWDRLVDAAKGAIVRPFRRHEKNSDEAPDVRPATANLPLARRPAKGPSSQHGRAAPKTASGPRKPPRTISQFMAQERP